MNIFLIIIAVLAVIAVYFVFSSIRLRLVFDEPTRLVEVSYAIARVSADLKEFKGRLRLFGIKVYERDLREMLRSDTKKARPKKKEREKPKTKEELEELVKDKLRQKRERVETKREKIEKEPKKKKDGWGFDLSMINMKNLRKFKNFIGKVKIRELNLEVWGGFSDPYRTGQLTASYWAVKGMFQSLMSHIQYYPDFNAEKFTFRGKGVVSLRIVHILTLVIQLLTSYLISKVRRRFKYQEKGLAYGG